MDRWRSGTPETCHSSHHHAVCTRSACLSLSLQVFFSSSSLRSIFFTPLSLSPSIPSSLLLYPDPSVAVGFLHNSTPSARLPSTPQQSVFLFFPPSFAPYRPAFLFWQPFLGFIISSGNIPPFFPPFSISLFLALSV